MDVGNGPFKPTSCLESMCSSMSMTEWALDWELVSVIVDEIDYKRIRTLPSGAATATRWVTLYVCGEPFSKSKACLVPGTWPFITCNLKFFRYASSQLSSQATGRTAVEDAYTRLYFPSVCLAVLPRTPPLYSLIPPSFFVCITRRVLEGTD